MGKLEVRFNEHGLGALSIAASRGRKATYKSEQRALILQEVKREPDREQDGTATWSLKTLERALRQKGLLRLGASIIREVLHEHGYSFQDSRTWRRTGYALRKRKSGTVTVYDVETPEKRLIELACEQAEAAGIVQLNEDEAGPYQAIPRPGVSWQPEGYPVLQLHEYERGRTAKMLTIFRPATGQIRAKGVVSVTNAVLHLWLKRQLGEVLAEIEKKQPAESLPLEEQRAPCAQWETWLGHPPRRPLPALRIVLVLDERKRQLTLVRLDAGGGSVNDVNWLLE